MRNATDILTILPSHMPTNAEGVPVLRSNRGGRRVRYAIEPIADLASPYGERSQASTASECQASTASESSSSASSSAGPTLMMSWLQGGARVKCVSGCGHSCDRASIDTHTAMCPSVTVGCPHAAMGCLWIKPRSALSSHLGSCPFHACQSFMTSTLRRLQALEEDNR